MKRADRVATLDEAKAQFQMSWDAWKAGAHFIIRDDVELTRVRWCALEQQVRQSWDAWKAWAKLEEVPGES
jgi:hypothetical protein